MPNLRVVAQNLILDVALPRLRLNFAPRLDLEHEGRLWSTFNKLPAA